MLALVFFHLLPCFATAGENRAVFFIQAGLCLSEKHGEQKKFLLINICNLNFKKNRLWRDSLQTIKWMTITAAVVILHHCLHSLSLPRMLQHHTVCRRDNSIFQFYFFFGLASKLPPPSADANKLSEFTQGFSVADHYIWARLPAKLKYQKQAWTHRGKSLKRRQSVFQAPVNCLGLFAWKMRRCKLKWRVEWTKKSLKL